MKKTMFAVIAIALSGCASYDPIPNDTKRVFTYDYQVPSAKKEKLWIKARDYLATAFIDSNQVIQVSDKIQGTIIGKAVSKWNINDIVVEPCASRYEIKFQAKDGKARLQLELLAGNAYNSSCARYTLPTQKGYGMVVDEFNTLAKGLENALKELDSTFSDF